MEVEAPFFFWNTLKPYFRLNLILSYLYTVNEKYGYIKEYDKENLCQVNKEKNKLHKKDFKRKKFLQ